ncbi:hypothetical protein CSKR_202641 [Clonorchis sinensis]|uniref:Uncharacterized protein n=1 Tax=Clonorchis sinensis TaxID=79923 RepID=A0A8T1M086_CLOSI|nr:hypothetical protein CSKR_202641 [Clonorchis sinensis]
MEVDVVGLIALGLCYQIKDDPKLSRCLTRCLEKWGDCPSGEIACIAGYDCKEYCVLKLNRKNGELEAAQWKAKRKEFLMIKEFAEEMLPVLFKEEQLLGRKLTDMLAS